MKRAMFDIETLSTAPTAAVIAIAVVIRDDDSPKQKQARSWFIDRDFVIGHQDPATLEWWSQQDERVRNQVLRGSQLPREVLQELNGFLQSHGINQHNMDVRCYAAPGMFDFPILRNQYQQLGILPAWHWRTERCLETLRHEIRDNFGIGMASVEPELKHHPVCDCLAQFEELDACLEELRLRNNIARNSFR